MRVAWVSSDSSKAYSQIVPVFSTATRKEVSGPQSLKWQDPRGSLMLRVGLGWVLLLVCLLPSSEAGICRDSTAFEIGGDRARTELVVLYWGHDAKEARNEIDHEVGNQDGELTRREVAAYEDKWTFDGDELRPSCSDEFTFLLIDGEFPSELLLFEKNMEDTEGMVGEKPLKYRIAMELLYPLAAADERLVKVNIGDFPSFASAMKCATGLGTDWLGDHVCGSQEGDPVAKPNYYAVAAGWGYQIARTSVEPAEVQKTWDDGELYARDLFDQSLLRTNTVHMRVTKGPAPLSLDSWQVGATMATMAAVGFAAWLWFSDLRFPLSRWFLLVAGFSRLDREQAVDHPRRQEVLSAVESNPGIRFNELGRRTEIPKGALAHHLRVLERTGYVKSKREGIWTRFYPPQMVSRSVPLVTTKQDEILRIVSRQPGLHQAALAQALGMERKAAQYHLDRLVAAGILMVTRDGPRRLYHVRPADVGLQNPLTAAVETL